MHRTQIYLPEQQYEALQRLGHQSGRSMAEMIRSAVHDFLTRESAAAKSDMLDASFGIWEDRDEDELRSMRRGWGKRESRNARSD